MGLGALGLGLLLGAGGGVAAAKLSESRDMPKPQGLPAQTIEPEAAKAKIDMAERLKRARATREKSRLTLPKMFGTAQTQKSILSDTLG